uniref:Uncharacterized protein n=1 Tax=Thermofilum pendens TaxID=2269 RepID=A0A7C4BAI9_THEPE
MNLGRPKKLLERLRRALGFSAEEDPLRREIGEAWRLAEEAVKAGKRVEKHLRRKRGKPGERGGLLRAAEELEQLFPEELSKE